jgi:hypothetical protein
MSCCVAGFGLARLYTRKGQYERAASIFVEMVDLIQARTGTGTSAGAGAGSLPSASTAPASTASSHSLLLPVYENWCEMLEAAGDIHSLTSLRVSWADCVKVVHGPSHPLTRNSRSKALGLFQQQISMQVRVGSDLRSVEALVRKAMAARSER